ncbi:MAG: AraC family ligand binding domain-containing protein [archaeon]
MIVRKNEAKEFKNSNNCVAYEYLLNDEDINVALIKINGRYPEKGFVLNEISKEICFITKGGGKVVVEGKEIELNEGDAILILPNKKYFFEGNLEIVVSCTPTWKIEQHKLVEE